MTRGLPRKAAHWFLFLICIVALNAMAAGTGELTERVHSAAGEPVGNATIEISGMAQRLKRGADSAFEIVVPAGDHELVVRSTRYGIESTDVRIGEGTTHHSDVTV